MLDLTNPNILERLLGRPRRNLLRPDDLEGYVKLTENAPLPITGCEVFTRRQSFLQWIERRAV